MWTNFFIHMDGKTVEYGLKLSGTSALKVLRLLAQTSRSSVYGSQMVEDGAMAIIRPDGSGGLITADNVAYKGAWSMDYFTAADTKGRPFATYKDALEFVVYQ
jgi:hypothetical protein